MSKLKNLNNIAIIPARAGSAGLKNKNILPVNNKLLIDFSIEAAVNSQLFSRIIVSTNIESLLKRKNNSQIEYHKREESVCTSKSSMLEVINWLIQKEHSLGSSDFFCLLQPTSPLRDHHDIEKSWNILENTKSDGCISVTEAFQHPLKALVLKDEKNHIEPLDAKSFSSNRQNLPQCFYPNGAIYWLKTTAFKEEKSFCPNNSVCYIMDKIKSIDIDSEYDFIKFKKLMEKKI